ncbi:hypothetical protein H0H92_006831 [Tricholoma furcatifolium]|nr:hypothetical protein H0H92_006831 [Tricholoma furcatifolium]
MEETVHHYLFECPGYEDQRFTRRRRLPRDKDTTKYLFGTRKGIKALLDFVNDTKCWKKTFGEVSSVNLPDDDDSTMTDDDETEGFWPDEGNGFYDGD